MAGLALRPLLALRTRVRSGALRPLLSLSPCRKSGRQRSSCLAYRSLLLHYPSFTATCRQDAAIAFAELAKRTDHEFVQALRCLWLPAAAALRGSGSRQRHHPCCGGRTSQALPGKPEALRTASGPRSWLEPELQWDLRNRFLCLGNFQGKQAQSDSCQSWNQTEPGVSIRIWATNLPSYSDPHNMSLYQMAHEDILRYVKKSCLLPRYLISNYTELYHSISRYIFSF